MRYNRLMVASSLFAMLAVPALAEEGTWAPVAVEMLADIKETRELYEEMKDLLGPNARASLVVRLKAEQKLASVRLIHLNRLIPLEEALYAVLTPAQQNLADTALAPHHHWVRTSWPEMELVPVDNDPPNVVK